MCYEIRRAEACVEYWIESCWLFPLVMEDAPFGHGVQRVLKIRMVSL